jgi:hypothetical protein
MGSGATLHTIEVKKVSSFRQRGRSVDSGFTGSGHLDWGAGNLDSSGKLMISSARRDR